MGNKIDISKLLKDCPRGMELDCTMYEDVYFDYVDELNIIHCYIQHENYKTSITFNQHGTPNSDRKSKCVIFPKGKTTWEGFQKPFKDGDIISAVYFDAICIFKNEGTLKGTVDYYCGISGSDELFIKDVKNQDEHFGDIDEYKLATKEEKSKLFQAIKDNGYKWNSETKTLEKLDELWTINDAKDGDVLAINWHKGDDYWEKIVIFKKYHNKDKCVEGYGNTFKNGKLAFHEEVPFFSTTWTSTLRPATKEQRDFLFQKIKEAGYEWNAETKTLKKLQKFKIGDRIRNKHINSGTDVIIDIEDNWYVLSYCDQTYLNFKCQDDWELVNDIKPIFKAGDIIYTKTYYSKWISIFEKIDNDKYKCYVAYCIGSDNYYGRVGYKNPLCEINDIVEQRLATEEEKAKLFQVIKDNGHTWNPKTKTLEKLVEPRFKVGNIIQDIDSYKVKITEVNIEYGCYEYESVIAKGIGSIMFDDQDNYELIPNKFDITTLKPFESKVLVRDINSDEWRGAFYSHYKSKKFYIIGGSYYYQCIPYEGNEYLLDTTNDCNNYYKNW